MIKKFLNDKSVFSSVEKLFEVKLVVMVKVFTFLLFCTSVFGDSVSLIVIYLKLQFFIIFSMFSNQSFEEKAGSFFKSGHTNNWAVLVDTSIFWFNYRHVANVLSIYRSVKRLGIPDR